MSSHWREVRKFIRKKIKQQRDRRQIDLSEFLHIETFAYCDGTVRLFSVAGDNINWCVDITNATFFELIETLKRAELDPDYLTNVNGSNCEFYVKHNEGKLELTIFFKSYLLQTVHESFYIEKKYLEKAIHDSAELKSM